MSSRRSVDGDAIELLSSKQMNEEKISENIREVRLRWLGQYT